MDKSMEHQLERGGADVNNILALQLMGRNVVRRVRKPSSTLEGTTSSLNELEMEEDVLSEVPPLAQESAVEQPFPRSTSRLAAAARRFSAATAPRNDPPEV